MDGELHEIWRDDRLVEAAARGDLHHAAGVDDVAAGPLCALAQVADARPLPRLDVDPAEVVAGRRNHRYAVRSLAVAVATVATLSTSGVSAVVTGDPFRPAKAVWHQIQDHTALRAGAGDQRAHSGAALGAPVEAATGTSPQPLRGTAPAERDTAAAQGQTAQAPSRAEPDDPAAPAQPAAAARAVGGGDGDANATETDDRAAERPGKSSAGDPAGREPERNSTGDQQGEDEQETQPAPADDPQPAPGGESDGDLDPLRLPGEPQHGEQQGAMPAPYPEDPSPEDSPSEDGDAVQEPLLTEPTAPTPDEGNRPGYEPAGDR